MRMLESLLDHEKRGVPDGAGTDSAKGFDLVRCMRGKGFWARGRGVPRGMANAKAPLCSRAWAPACWRSSALGRRRSGTCPAQATGRGTSSPGASDRPWHFLARNVQGPLKALLAELGHPERVCKAVHVSGTKGKGSTAAMLAAGLTASGYKTGCYSRFVLGFVGLGLGPAWRLPCHWGGGEGGPVPAGRTRLPVPGSVTDGGGTRAMSAPSPFR